MREKSMAMRTGNGGRCKRVGKVALAFLVCLRSTATAVLIISYTLAPV